VLTAVKKEIARRGPSTAGELTDHGKVAPLEWYGWKGTGRATSMALEVLWTRCELVVAGRGPGGKRYDLPERALPETPGRGAALGQVLEGFGYAVLSAGGADVAIDLSDRHAGPIHLLLTDVVMPRMGGADLARRIAERRPEVSVLYMSGHASDAVVRHGVLERASGFLQKPFAPEQLAAKIREILG
jgi:CheY-like chemotaxis protein